MKKIVTLMLLVLGMSLTGCANMSEENKEQKEEIDMTKLPYVAHLPTI